MQKLGGWDDQPLFKKRVVSIWKRAPAPISSCYMAASSGLCAAVRRPIDRLTAIAGGEAVPENAARDILNSYDGTPDAMLQFGSRGPGASKSRCRRNQIWCDFAPTFLVTGAQYCWRPVRFGEALQAEFPLPASHGRGRRPLPQIERPDKFAAVALRFRGVEAP